VRHDDVRLDLLEPGRHRFERRLVGLQFLVGIIEGVRPGAENLAGSRGLPAAHGRFQLVADLALAPVAGGVADDHLFCTWATSAWTFLTISSSASGPQPDPASSPSPDVIVAS